MSIKQLSLKYYRYNVRREKCPYSEFVWSVFSRIRTEYGEILRISPYSVRMRENTDRKNSEYGHFYAVMPVKLSASGECNKETNGEIIKKYKNNANIELIKTKYPSSNEFDIHHATVKQINKSVRYLNPRKLLDFIRLQ